MDTTTLVMFMLGGLLLSTSLLVLLAKYLTGLWNLRRLDKAKLTLATKQPQEQDALEFLLELPDEKSLTSIRKIVKAIENESGIRIEIISKKYQS